METPSLRVQDLRVAYDDRVVIDGLDLDIPPGRITAIVGPNACGKSTLLRTLARLLTPKSGGVYLDGRSIHDLPTRQVAQQLGILPQSPVAPEGMTVADLVGRGRAPHQSWWRQWSTSDEGAVAAALAATEMTDPPTARWTSSPAASGSGRGSRWRSRRTPRCCCSTSPRRTSTWPTRS